MGLPIQSVALHRSYRTKTQIVELRHQAQARNGYKRGAKYINVMFAKPQEILHELDPPNWTSSILLEPRYETRRME